MQELDRVTLIVDLPELGLEAGMDGTVLMVFENPESYLVEFTALGEMEPIAMPFLDPKQVVLLESLADRLSAKASIDPGLVTA